MQRKLEKKTRSALAGASIAILLLSLTAWGVHARQRVVHKSPEKVVVLNGRAVYRDLGDSVNAETGRLYLLDKFNRIRGMVRGGEKQAVEDACRRVESGIYLLTSGSASLPSEAREGTDAVTETGDVDGDGDMDIVIARELAPVRLLINEGGGFSDQSFRMPSVLGFITDIELLDANGDGALDVFLTSNDAQNMLLVNDGEGIFYDSTFTHLPVDSSGSQGACWGDVDGDSDVDIFVVNLGVPLFPESEANQLLINDGRGRYTDETVKRFMFEPRLDVSLDALMLDVDGDRDLDIVIANDNVEGDFPRLLVNDGTGFFADESSERFPNVGGSCISVASGDLDGNSVPDLYFANYFWEMNFLWINTGGGHFSDEAVARTPSESPVDSSWSVGCDIADIDLDGDLDILVGNFPVQIDSSYFGRGRNRLLRNDGKGFFGDETALVMPDVEDATNDIDFIDADGNPYIDFYVTNWAEPNQLVYDPARSLGARSDRGNFPALPHAFELFQNRPNPFNPSTTIEYVVPGWQVAEMDLRIYNLRGQLVRKLVDGERSPGRHSVHWDGRDGEGKPVGSGVYIYRLIADSFVSTKKMIVTR